MNLFRRLIFTGLFLGSLVGANAQNNSLGKNDPDAKKVLDGLSAKLKSYKAVQANFTLTVQDGKGKVQGSKSGIIYLKGGKYHISVTGQEIFCDGKDVWTYDKSSNEVTIQAADASAKTISPDKFFSNFYDKDFLYKLNGETKANGKAVQEVELTPVDKTRPYYKAYLYIDKTQHTMSSLKWLDKSGNVYVITTTKLNGNAPLTDANFVFNKAKFPGVEEVDLRN